jgi:hypothetical protein
MKRRSAGRVYVVVINPLAVTERYGTIGDDLVEREAQRLVQG